MKKKKQSYVCSDGALIRFKNNEQLKMGLLLLQYIFTYLTIHLVLYDFMFGKNEPSVCHLNSKHLVHQHCTIRRAKGRGFLQNRSATVHAKHNIVKCTAGTELHSHWPTTTINHRVFLHLQLYCIYN